MHIQIQSVFKPLTLLLPASPNCFARDTNVSAHKIHIHAHKIQNTSTHILNTITNNCDTQNTRNQDFSPASSNCVVLHFVFKYTTLLLWQVLVLFAKIHFWNTLKKYTLEKYTVWKTLLCTAALQMTGSFANIFQLVALWRNNCGKTTMMMIKGVYNKGARGYTTRGYTTRGQGGIQQGVIQQGGIQQGGKGVYNKVAKQQWWWSREYTTRGYSTIQIS